MGALRMIHQTQLQSVLGHCGAALSAAPKRQCVIVCGMHRSGTSALTRVINLLGADIAHDLIPPHPENLRGYWESAAVIRIHEDLLQSLGSFNEDPLSLPAGWEGSCAAQCAERRLENLIKQQFAESRTFVVKDPRISRLLPLWIGILAQMDIDPIVVIPFRNPLEVAASLAQRAAAALSKALLLYFHSYLETELASRGAPRFFIRYDELLGDWRLVQNRLNALSNGRFPAPRALAKAAIEEFLSSDLRHHRFSREQLVSHPDVPPAIVEMFDALCEAAGTGDERSLRSTLDRFRAIYGNLGSLYRDFVVAERQALRDAFERSTSWRATAPLRWFKQKATGHR